MIIRRKPLKPNIQNLKYKHMKKILFINIILLSNLILLSQSQLQNNSFEDWISLGTSDSVEHWNNAVNFNTVLGTIRISTAEKSTESNSGNFSIKLQGKTYLTHSLPGMVTLGAVNIANLPNPFKGGVPFTDRPLGVSFRAKYTISETDTAFMVAVLTKYNEGKTDTVGITFFPITQNTPEFTEFVTPFVYLKTIEPDTMNMVFVSTNPLSAKSTSALFVDDVKMMYEIGAFPTLALPATEITDKSFVANWLPALNSEEYIIDVATDNSFLNILSEYNNLVVNTSNFLVEIPEAEQGQDAYFYRVRVKYGDTTVSTFSNVVEVLPNLPPIAFDADEIDGKSFKAHWSKISRATSYSLDVATDAEFENIVENCEDINTIDTFYTVMNLEPGTEYFYRVKTNYLTGVSPFSNIIQVATIVGIDETTEFKNFYTKNNTLYINGISNCTQINIYDVIGRKIYAQKPISSNIEINLKKNNIYILELKINNKLQRIKIIL